LDALRDAIIYAAMLLATAVLGGCAVGLLASVKVLLWPAPGDSRAMAWRGVLWYGAVPASVATFYWLGWRALRAVGLGLWALAAALAVAGLVWTAVALLRRRHPRLGLRVSLIVNGKSLRPIH